MSVRSAPHDFIDRLGRPRKYVDVHTRAVEWAVSPRALLLAGRSCDHYQDCALIVDSCCGGDDAGRAVGQGGPSVR